MIEKLALIGTLLLASPALAQESNPCGPHGVDILTLIESMNKADVPYKEFVEDELTKFKDTAVLLAGPSLVPPAGTVAIVMQDITNTPEAEAGAAGAMAFKGDGCSIGGVARIPREIALQLLD